MKKGNDYKVIAAAILILVVLFFYFSIVKYDSLEHQIKQSVETRGLISIGIFSFILDFLPQYISPHIFIIMNGLMGFGFPPLILLVILGSSIGSIVGFEIGRKMKNGNELLSFIGKRKIEVFKKNINGWKKWIVTIAAISPLPYIPLVLGMFDMSRKNFLVYGVIPRIIGFVLLGILFM